MRLSYSPRLRMYATAWSFFSAMTNVTAPRDLIATSSCWSFANSAVRSLYGWSMPTSHHENSSSCSGCVRLSAGLAIRDAARVALATFATSGPSSLRS